MNSLDYSGTGKPFGVPRPIASGLDCWEGESWTPVVGPVPLARSAQNSLHSAMRHTMSIALPMLASPSESRNDFVLGCSLALTRMRECGLAGPLPMNGFYNVSSKGAKREHSVN